MDLNRVKWQQTLRAMALQGLTDFPTFSLWLEGKNAEETRHYYTEQGERSDYEQWCHYLKAGIFQGISLQDYEEWKSQVPE